MISVRDVKQIQIKSEINNGINKTKNQNLLMTKIQECQKRTVFVDSCEKNPRMTS